MSDYTYKTVPNTKAFYPLNEPQIGSLLKQVGYSSVDI
jgi:hypothetical protein